MSGLFVELYLDEDVDVLVADLLRARGFSATTASESGQLRRDDEEQLAYAVSKQCALLTHNRADFETLALTYFAKGEVHYGNHPGCAARAAGYSQSTTKNSRSSERGRDAESSTLHLNRSWLALECFLAMNLFSV